MNNILKLQFGNRRRLSSLLGLALDGNRLEGAVLKRTNGHLRLQGTFSVPLSLDPLAGDVELVGHEIHTQLAAQGVHERHCVVCLPLKWALVASTEIPELADADAAQFLQIEAERGFHADIESLYFTASRFQGPPAGQAPAPALAAESTQARAPGPKQYATLVAVPRANVTRLEQALRAARLKPLSFSTGITALQRPGMEAGRSAPGVLALLIGQSHVGLQITCGGGVAALRALEGAVEVEAGRAVVHAEVVAREARITLGQLPEELRGTVRVAKIFGPRDQAQQLADELDLRFEPLGLDIQVPTRHEPGQFDLELPPEAPVLPAFNLAADRLAGRGPVFEFLPPRVPAWRQLAQKYGSGKYRIAVASAAVVAGIGAAIFLFQQWQLARLQSQWNALAPRVAEVQALQDKIQKFQAWYDQSHGGLEILRQLTLAFPEDGAVSAKTLEIRDLNTVTCTGVARDYQALLRVTSQLRGREGVSDVRVETLRGRSPMQFTFDFHWNGGVNAD